MAQPRPKQDSVISALLPLNLSENEAVLYRLMLEKPQSTVQELSIRAPFPRTMLYYVLNRLMQRGLVSAKKGNSRTVYVAEDPEHLYDLLSEKEREFEREKENVRELIPRLKQQYRLAGERPNVRIFEGAEEYKKALEDILIAKPTELLSYELLRKKPMLELRESFDGRRVAKKIQKKILFFEDAETLKQLKAHAYDDYTQFRSMTSAALFAADVMLYDGKLLYTSYSGEDATAVLIEDRALFEMQKNLFDVLWKQGKDRTLAYIEKP